MIELFQSPEVWFALLTLTFLEIVLGIDNILFITISAEKLQKAEQKKAIQIGLLLAMLLRIILLLGISVLTASTAAFLSFDIAGFSGELSIQVILLFLGGIFLLYKSTKEIHEKVEFLDAHKDATSKQAKGQLSKVILEITLLNLVFSIDSILTAMGMTNGISENPNHTLVIMIIAVVVSMIIMLAFAARIGRFVNERPSMQILGLAFLLLIGFMLIIESAHLGHFSVFGKTIGEVPKGYLYFAIAFSVLVEFLDLRRLKNTDLKKF